MTVSNSTDTALESFHRDGFVGPIKLYTPQTAREILDRIRINNIDTEHILFDNDVNYDRHFDIPELTRHIGHPAIVDMVRRIAGPDLLCWRSEFFPKFPGSAGTEWHQVANYQYATGSPMLRSVDADDTMLDLTVWTAFTDATRENGCMKFLPGSHTRLYYDESKPSGTGREDIYESVSSDTSFYGYTFEDFKIDPEWIPDEQRAVAMEMRAGECVIFSARCVHASFPNSTRRSTRFAITSRYTPARVQVYPGWSEFTAHGGHFDLSRYGCVQVAGEDRYRHNRLRQHSNRGGEFPYLGTFDRSVIERAADAWGEYVLDHAPMPDLVGS